MKNLFKKIGAVKSKAGHAALIVPMLALLPASANAAAGSIIPFGQLILDFINGLITEVTTAIGGMWALVGLITSAIIAVGLFKKFSKTAAR
jgi:hypothetical protein